MDVRHVAQIDIDEAGNIPVPAPQVQIHGHSLDLDQGTRRMARSIEARSLTGKYFITIGCRTMREIAPSPGAPEAEYARAREPLRRRAPTINGVRRMNLEFLKYFKWL